jgi:hypothetical protein
MLLKLNFRNFVEMRISQLPDVFLRILPDISGAQAVTDSNCPKPDALVAVVPAFKASVPF